MNVLGKVFLNSHKDGDAEKLMFLIIKCLKFIYHIERLTQNSIFFQKQIHLETSK